MIVRHYPNHLRVALQKVAIAHLGGPHLYIGLTALPIAV
jgi:hypothetical protein